MRKIFQSLIILLISIQTFGQWQWVHPRPCGNAVLSMTAVDSAHVWMAGTGGTIVYTTDGGDNWELSLLDTNVMLKSVSFIDTQNGWVSALGGFVYKTTDGGNTWSKSSIGTSFPGDICFTDSLNGWIGRQFSPEILQTLDGGVTWYSSTIGLTTSTYCVSFSDPLNGWVAGDGPLMSHTTDGGESWNLVYTSLPLFLRRLCTPNSLTIYAITLSDSKIRYSWDGGITWGLRAPTSFIWENMYFPDKNHGWAVGFNSASAPIYSEGRIERTTDGAVTFTNLFKLTGRSYLDNVTASDSLNAWVTGRGGMILATNDGGVSWEKQSYSLSNPHSVNDIFTIKDQNTAWAVGSGGFIIKTIDDGINWESQGVDPMFDLNTVYFLDSDNGFVAGDNYKLLRTQDGGENWELIPTPVSGDIMDLYFQNSMCGWMAGTRCLFKSIDGGLSWESKFVPSTNITMVDIEFTDSLHGWAVGNGDNGSVFISLFAKTTDGGETWESTFINVPVITSISFSDNLNGWMCGDHGAILSTNDGGLSWNQVTYHQYANFNSVCFIDSENGWIVGEGPVNGGSYGGIAIYTNDGGHTWQRKDVGVGRPLRSVIFTDNEFGYATGVEGTVLRWGENYLGIDNQKSSNIDHIFDLFPNPADNEITIAYELKAPSSVIVTIYSTAGRIVSSVMKEHQPTGSYTISFGSETLLPGIYFCNFKAGKTIQTRKFIKY